MDFFRTDRRQSRGWTALVLAAVLGSSGACRRSPDAHVKSANDFYKAGKYGEAIIEYRVALQSAPNRGDIRRVLSDAYFHTGDGENGLLEAIRAADLLPHDIEAQINAGRLLLQLERFVDARTRADKALAIDPKNVDAQILLGNALASLKDTDAALARYHEALLLSPNKDEAYVNIGQVQAARGDRAEAEAAFRKAVDVAPTSVPARLALANYLWTSGRPADTERALKEALALAPANVAANRALGMFYLASNRQKDAEPYFKAIADTTRTASAALTLADYYALAGRSDDARAILTDLAKRPEAAVDAETALAALDSSAGNTVAALARLKTLLGAHPKEKTARLLSAQILFRTGQKESALAEATRITTDAPDSAEAAEAYVIIGQVNAQLDRPSDAVQAFQEAIKRQAKPFRADLALGTLQLAAGEPESARAYAQQALTIDASNLDARALMVRVLLAERSFAQAGQEVNALLKAFPRSAVAYDLAGAHEVALGHLDAARTAYFRAAALAPNDLEATTGIVRIDLKTGRAGEAVARVETQLREPNPSSDVLMAAARTYATVKNTAKAEALLKQAIDRDPARLEAYQLLGQFYISQNRIAEAQSEFQQIVQRTPSSVSANTMLGMLLELERRQPEAEAQYQKVLSIDSTAPVAANNLAWLYVSQNRKLDAALSLAQTAQKQLPEEPHVNDTLGWIYYRKGIPSPAVGLLEASVKTDPSDPVTHYHLGMAYAATGEPDKARKALTDALRMAANFDGAADARSALTHLHD